jgi:hypothetical protein
MLARQALLLLEPFRQPQGFYGHLHPDSSFLVDDGLERTKKLFSFSFLFK